MLPRRSTHPTLFPATPPSVEQVTHNRTGFWFSAVLALLGLLLCIALFNYVLIPIDWRLQGAQLIGVGFAISLIPSLIWLVAFHIFDWQEPEPKRGVVRVFAFAALLAGVLLPLLANVFQISTWLETFWWSHLAGSILVVGFTQAAVIYAAVRYGIYFDPEFNARLDGIIYGAAAGLGLATALNLFTILDQGSLNTTRDLMFLVANALAYAGLGGLLGYFLGLSRFERTPFYFLPGGIILIAIFTGFFVFLHGQTTLLSTEQQATQVLLVAVALSAGALGMAFLLIRRANLETQHLYGIEVIDKPAISSATFRNKGRQSASSAKQVGQTHGNAIRKRSEQPSPSHVRAAEMKRVPVKANVRGRTQEVFQRAGNGDRVADKASPHTTSQNRTVIIQDLEESWHALMGDKTAASRRDIIAEQREGPA